MASPLYPVVERVKKRIQESPKIRDSSHLDVSDQVKGFLFWRTYVLQVVGRVNSQEELDEINVIVAEEAKGFDVVNTVRAQYRA
ncbi:MAG: hypothetical protein JXB03_05295 [Spirochaetales bacterium]|nr:hypothetical protein [Spirochaetales bacterium]